MNPTSRVDNELKATRHITMEELLLDYCRDVTKSIEEPEVVAELLRRGADPSYYFQCAISLACQSGYVQIVNMLLNDKRVDARGHPKCRPLLSACKRGHINVVRTLLGHCIWPRDMLQAAISVAASASQDTKIAMLDMLERHMRR